MKECGELKSDKYAKHQLERETVTNKHPDNLSSRSRERVHQGAEMGSSQPQVLMVVKEQRRKGGRGRGIQRCGYRHDE